MKSLTHKKKNILNAITGLLLTIVSAIVSFAFVRLVITYFMDDVNGVVRTATSLISYANLFQGGFGAAVIYSFYKYVASNNKEKINQILSITHKWFKRICLFYILFLVIFSASLPFIISRKDNDFNIGFLLGICFAIGATSIFTYLVSEKYILFIKANNNGFITNIMILLSTLVVNLIVLILMVFFHQKRYYLLIYLFIISFKNILVGIAVKMYAVKKMSYLDPNVDIEKEIEKEFKGKAFSSLVHQVATLIVFSTDEITLTIYSHSIGAKKALILISIYSSYYMLANFASVAISLIVSSVENNIGLKINSKEGMEGGEMVRFEYISQIFTAFMCLILIIILPQWTNLLFNSNGIKEYFSPTIGFLMSLTVLFHTFRIPSLIIINSHGHYKETRNRAMIEAFINLSASMTLVWFLGVYGVLIGTIMSYSYRTIDMTWYSMKFIEPKHRKTRIIGIVFNFFVISLGALYTFFIPWGVFNFKQILIMTIMVTWLTSIISYLYYKIADKIIKNKQRRQNDFSNNTSV